MQTYKIETTITSDGKIILPANLKNIYNHKVEILLLDREGEKSVFNFGIYDLGGQLDGFDIRDAVHDD